MDAIGAVGGILLFWDSRVLELMDLVIGMFSISCQFRNCEDGFQWTFSGVYGPILDCNRDSFWDELGVVRGLWEGLWCVGGDFNMIRFPCEHRRGGRISFDMRRFFEVIEDLGLRDIPLTRGPFTWRGGRNNGSMSRLGHFLFSDDWEGYFSNMVQSTLVRLVSDYFLILLDVGGIRRGPSPFRFEIMWLRVEGFKDLLKNWWQSLNFSDTFSLILASKLKALKAFLKSWNRDVFGRVEVNKCNALHSVNYWDELEEDKPLSLEDFEEWNLAKEDFKYQSLFEEVSWRQKSREL